MGDHGRCGIQVSASKEPKKKRKECKMIHQNVSGTVIRYYLGKIPIHQQLGVGTGNRIRVPYRVNGEGLSTLGRVDKNEYSTFKAAR